MAGKASWAVLRFAALGGLLGLTCVPFIRRLIVDDWADVAVLDGTLSLAQGVTQSGPWDLFRFYGGDPAIIQQAKQASTTPWFTHPELKLAFWRPLSSLLIALDHRLFGTWVPGYLLHSIVWYAALCAVVAALFRRILPEKIAALAALLFAVLGTHAQSVVWSSARNSLVCALLGCLALLAQLKAREDGFRAGQWLSLGLLALALLAGEAGLGMAAFLLAYELLGSRDPLAVRVRHALPLVGLVAAWLTAYVLMGYGTHGSGEYLNPLQDPLGYVRAFPLRMGNALSVLLAGAPADVWFLAPAARICMAVLGALSVALLAPWLWSVAKPLPPEVRRPLAWLTLGMTLAVLPQLAGVLGPRSFVIPSIGSAAIVAVLVVSAFERTKVWPKAGASVLLFAHGVLGALMWVGGSALYSAIIAGVETNYAAMGLRERSAAGRSFLVLSTSEVFSGLYAPLQFAALNRTRIGSWRLLSLCECDHTLTQISDRRFELKLHGSLLSSPFAAMLHSPRTPPRVGERVELSDLAIEVLSADESGQPTSFSVELKANPLPELWAWTDGKMERLEMLLPGQSRTLRWLPP